MAGQSISAETRFDAAYKTIMQCALVALMANGYRPDTNRPARRDFIGARTLSRDLSTSVT